MRLHCAVPTWAPASDSCMLPHCTSAPRAHTTRTGVDLHDLHDLRARFLVIVHDLVTSLRSRGVRWNSCLTTGSLADALAQIQTSYCLAPSSSICLIAASAPEVMSSCVVLSAAARDISAVGSDLLRDTNPTKCVSAHFPAFVTDQLPLALSEKASHWPNSSRIPASLSRSSHVRRTISLGHLYIIALSPSILHLAHALPLCLNLTGHSWMDLLLPLLFDQALSGSNQASFGPTDCHVAANVGPLCLALSE